MRSHSNGLGRAALARAVLATLFVAACSGSDDPAAPSGGGSIIDGVTMTAQVVEVEHTNTGIKQVTIRVTLTNTGQATANLSYLATCPVRFRLYRVLDQSLVFDETAVACANVGAVDLAIPPQESRELNSGTRNPWTLHGDSLPMGAYSAAGVVHIVGVGPVEVDAGTYLMPSCDELTATCIYPPASIQSAALAGPAR